MGASVRSRLLNLAKERSQPFQLLLTRYVLERLLYRLSQTKYRDRFILKGAMLLTKLRRRLSKLQAASEKGPVGGKAGIQGGGD